MSEFDQEGRKWFANPDFNPAQCNVVAAEHRESRTAVGICRPASRLDQLTKAIVITVC